MVKNKDVSTIVAEEELLASLFYMPDKIVEIIDELNPELFSVKEFGIIYRCVIELWKENIIPDEVTVLNRATNFGHNLTPELVKKLANKSTKCFKRQLKEWAKIIQNNAFKRKTVNMCEEFLNSVKDMGSPEKTIESFLNLAIDMQDKMRAESTASMISVDINSLSENMDDRFNNPNKIGGFTTGYTGLDAKTDGIRPGEIWTVTGMNSGGKSYVTNCMQLLQALYLLKTNDTRKIFVQTPEMTKLQLVNRYIEMLSGIDAKYINNPKLYFMERKEEATLEAYAKFKEIYINAGKIVNQLPIIIDDFSGPSALESANNIKKFHAKYGLACAYMDYADLFENEGYDDYKNQYQSYKVWKRVAKDTGVPVVIVNQYLKDLKLNKAEGYRGTMQNISGGKAAMNDSHVILHVYRPEVFTDYVNATKNAHMLGKTYLYSDKLRDRFFGSTMQDLEFQKSGGILKESSQIQAERQQIVNGVFG